jgi:hypothetical protein
LLILNVSRGLLKCHGVANNSGPLAQYFISRSD